MNGVDVQAIGSVEQRFRSLDDANRRFLAVRSTLENQDRRRERIYNLLQASNVLNMNTTYSPPGGVWQDVTQILGGRLVRLGVQFDF